MVTMASSEEIAARVAALEAVVQLVETKTDAHAASSQATDAEIAKVKSVVDQVVGGMERRLKAVEESLAAGALGFLSPRARLPERPSEGYIPQKDLMPKFFSDKPEDWRAWREDVLDWIDSVNPGVKDVLEAINKWEDWDEFD